MRKVLPAQDHFSVYNEPKRPWTGRVKKMLSGRWRQGPIGNEIDNAKAQYTSVQAHTHPCFNFLSRSQYQFSMHKPLKILLSLIVSMQILTACTVFQTTESLTELDSFRNQRSANALLAVLELEDIDTLIKLDNRWLARHFESVIKSQSELAEGFSIRNLEIEFNSQIIYLKTIVNVEDDLGNTITAAATGDVVLKYRGKGLEWRPLFRQLQIDAKEFDYAGNNYTEADSELVQSVLLRLNADLADAVVNNNRNIIPLNPVPLGEIQVGAGLPGFTESIARSTQDLRGVFMLAGSSLLIDSSETSIALDMTFIPDLSTCPADVTVSRSVFARDIDSREPVGIARNINSAADVGYYYSEIQGAKQPLTIIHYWFADGMPLTAKELTVGPSETWRTWSSRDQASNDASLWEVLVVEKESGCILASRSIRTFESETLITRVGPAQATQTFAELKDAFSRRTSGFSIVNESPGIAQIEIRRPFLRDVLQASLSDLTINAGFDGSGLSALQYSAQLQVFDSSHITCERRDCPQVEVCKASLAQCKRLRDTRDCSSCQFRNPLNNRCVSQAVDPLCEAARKRQNARYDEERAACISQAENAKQECDRLNEQVLSSCQIESGLEESSCKSIKTRLQSFNPGTTLAHVSAQARPSGTLNASFSNFSFDGDLDRLRMDLSLRPNLYMNGELSFKPTGVAKPLEECISAWKAPFRSRFTSTAVIHSLINSFDQGSSMLTAKWSGFGITLDTQPSPLESIFVNNPQLLANCNIGLTVSEVEQAIKGVDAAFFQGSTDLIIHPLPTMIHLAPASIVFGNMVYSSDAELSSRHLKYDIRE
jgi:hypothetical protein